MKKTGKTKLAIQARSKNKSKQNKVTDLGVRARELHGKFLLSSIETDTIYIDSITAFTMALVNEHDLNKYDPDITNGWLEKELAKHLNDISSYPDRICNKLRLSNPLILLSLALSILIHGRNSQRGFSSIVENFSNLVSEKILESDL